MKNNLLQIKNIKFFLLIIFIIFIFIIYFKYNNIENFQSSFINQYGNVIYHFEGDINAINKEPTITLSENDNNNIYTINLDNKMNITDIYLDLHLNNKIKNISIGVLDTRKNELNLLNINPISNEDITKKNISTSILLNNVKDKYNNNVYGNQIIIYINKNVLNTKQDNINTITISICGIILENNINENKLNYLIDKSNILNNTDIISLKDLDVFSNKNKSKLYTLTLIDFSNIDLKNKKLEFYLLYTNTYSNEIMTYKSDIKTHKFIITPTFPKIILYNDILMVNNIYLKDISNDIDLSKIIIKGYISNVNDINQFKLQHNITDIRGSINPDNICPSINNLLQDQLNSETIIDAIDYQNKINEEKIKLNSRKEALLTLLEQKEDISRLGSMIDTIDNISQKRDINMDTYNAIKLNKQIDEITKLRELLDARIKLNNDNTYNFDKINLIVKRDATDDEITHHNLENNDINVIDNFINLPNNEQYKL